MLLLLFILGIKRRLLDSTYISLPDPTSTPAATPQFSLEAGWLAMIIILGILIIGVVITLVIVAVYFFTTKGSSAQKGNEEA